MTNQSNGSPHPYDVSISKKVADEIKAVIEKARLAGITKKVIAALRLIHERLRSNPLEFGEFRFHWSKAKCRCHVAVVEPVAIQFSIHDEKPVVFLTKVHLLGA